MPVPRSTGRFSRLVPRPRAVLRRLGAVPGLGGRRLRAVRVLRRRPVLAASGAAAVVLAVLAGGDVVLAHTARDRIADAAACRLRPSGPVSARLSGAFAGLRLLTGDVGTVRITARDVRREGTTLTVSAELHGVTTSGSMAGGSATATLSYDELSRKAGGGVAGLRPGDDGHGGLLLTGTLAGIPLPLTVHTRLTASDGELTVTPTDVVVLGEDFALDRLAAAPSGRGIAAKLAPRTVTLPQLPHGVRLTGASATPEGLRLRLALAPAAASGRHSGCAG